MIHVSPRPLAGPAPVRQLRRAVRLSTAIVLLGALLYGSASRRESLALWPDLLAAAGAALLAVAVTDAVFVLMDLRARRIGRVRALAALAVLGGVLLAGGSALHGWLSRVEGFLVLQEREAAQLASTRRVAEFEAGPLAPIRELASEVRLERLELSAADRGSVTSRSRLRVVDPQGRPADVEVGSGASSAFGALQLHQGAFGVSPRITVTRDGKPVYDASVPFTARHDRGDEVAFSGTAPVHGEGLLLTGCVSMDPRDLGGPGTRLRVRLADGGDMVGRATLALGTSAEVGKGYRVEFPELGRWSEIHVTQRSRREPLVAGAVLALLGAVVWPVAAWKRW